MSGEQFTRWTIRLALALYFVGLAALILWRAGAAGPRGLRTGRWAWSLGAVAYLIHVAAAFTFFHHWSHRTAYRYTAMRTAELSGISWGGGLYFNYAFSVLWLVDIAWWWVNARSYRARPAWVTALIQGFLFFIAFNSTVVFASGYTRWIAVAATVVLVALWLCTLCRSAPRR